MNERWKYTDLTTINEQKFAVNLAHQVTQAEVDVCRLTQGDTVTLVMVNGKFAPDLSNVAALPEGVIVIDMQAARLQHALLLKQFLVEEVNAADYPFAAANLSSKADGLFLYVPENTQLAAPIHLLMLTQGAEPARNEIQNLFVFGKQSVANVLQEYVSQSETPYFNNALTMINLQANSRVQWVKHQHEQQQATHMENVFVHQAEDSYLSVTQISNGAQFARDDVLVHLQAPGAVCQSSGFYHTRRDGQYVDHHIDIHHLEKNTQSDMLYKGIMDKKSKAVFNGRLLVSQHAQKVQAVQGNHHLLLSPFAEAYSKPELEIYADDVKCRHGATTGQIDQDALFYLRARGIDRDSAMTLLLKGFAEDVLQRIQHPVIQQHIRKQVNFDA